jgi:hypothetical protein
MNNQLQFMNHELWWVALPLAFLLVLLFVWKEWRGAFDGRFVINSLVGMLAMGALLLLYLRPALLTEISGKAILLTENYRVPQLDSLKAKEKSIPIIRYRSGLNFSKFLDSINEVVVLGNGLSSYDFWQLQDVSTTYLKGAVPKGIVKLKYENRLQIGENLFVSGLYNQPSSGNRLVLETNGGQGLDSIVLKGATEQGFELESNVKAKGKFVYQLSEKDSTGVTLNSNPLPVEVVEKEPLRIFIINRFPSFETKYLKNFLAEEGHELVVRSQITKGRYKFEYFNTERRPVYGLAKNELKDFDLVVLDTDTYLGLSKNNKEVFLTLIEDAGLGLFVQPSENLFRASNEMVRLQVERDTRQKNLEVENIVLEKYPYKFLNVDSRGIVLENHSYVSVIGKGRFSTSLLSTTFQLVLDGKTEAYAKIWTTIIAASARDKEVYGAFEKLNEFSFIGEPNSFSILAEEERPELILNAEYNIPLVKSAVLEDRWQGKTYPTYKGWHSLRLVSDTTVSNNFYVMDSIYWKSVKGLNMIGDNSRFFDKTKNEDTKKVLSVEISQWWFLFIFLACMGYLWLVPKLKA